MVYDFSALTVVSALYLRSTGQGFDFQPLHFWAATLDKSFKQMPNVADVRTVWRCRNLINLNLI